MTSGAAYRQWNEPGPDRLSNWCITHDADRFGLLVMDVLSAIGLAIAAVISGPLISNSLGRIRRAENARKERS